MRLHCLCVCLTPHKRVSTVLDIPFGSVAKKDRLGAMGGGSGALWAIRFRQEQYRSKLGRKTTRRVSEKSASPDLSVTSEVVIVRIPPLVACVYEGTVAIARLRNASLSAWRRWRDGGEAKH
jgi:hypothetical protein